jgi:hypothetical protein
MILFEQYFKLYEEAGPNKHLTHLEELVLTNKRDGANRAIGYLNALSQVLDSGTKKAINTTVKYDGAPAVVIGRDPNGNFFVGSKSVFNAEPKLNYSIKDIKINHAAAPGLVDKLVKTFVHFKDTNIDGVYQGDFLFDNEIKKTAVIDGEDHVTFKPNTIVYAVPTNSKEGQDILNSDIGVVFHTEYDVQLDEEGKPRFNTKKFGVDVSTLDPGPKVYVKDAYFENDAGYVTLTDEETGFIRELIQQATQLTKEINFDGIDEDIYKGLNTYINTEIRQGEFLKDTDVSFQQYVEWVEGRMDRKIDSLKSDRGKQKASQIKDQMLGLISSAKEDITKLLKLQVLIKQGKDIFIQKYNNIMKGVSMKHYLFDDNGDLVVTEPEGYVAVDAAGGAIKFVDRLEFSKANFTLDKSFG